MARQVRGWDALRAWRFIRASKAYRDAWAKRLPMPGLPERAPFPVRLQTAADLAAAAWGMAALEDPHAERPLAPFWRHAGVIDGRVAPDAPPLARLAAEGGAALSGLRLGDGALMLWIERERRSVQVRLPRGWRTPAGPRGRDHRGCLARRPGPSAGTGEDGDGELLLALESEAEGHTRREVAVRLWGRERVAEEYCRRQLDAYPRQAPPGAREGDPETVSRHGDGQVARRRAAALYGGAPIAEMPGVRMPSARKFGLGRRASASRAPYPGRHAARGRRR